MHAHDKFILYADTVLPISSEPINEGAVLVSEGVISEVGTQKSILAAHGSAPRLNLGKGTLLPGLINAHTHLELGWIKGRIGSFNGFIDWIAQIIKFKREDITSEDIQNSVLAGIERLKETGVTTVGEVSSYGGLDEPLLRESGLRTVLFREFLERNAEEVSSSAYSKDDETFEVRPFPHAPYTCSTKLIKEILESTVQNNVPVGIHLAESMEEVKFIRSESNGFDSIIFPLVERFTEKEGSHPSPYSYLKDIGFFDGVKSTLIHMLHVSKSEFDDLSRRDTGIVLCPRSNYFLNVGEPDVERISKLRRVGIGTDGLSSAYNLDILEEMRFLHLISSRKNVADAAKFAVYTATLGGARALFLEDKIGSIEAGKEADLVFIAHEGLSTNPYATVLASGKDDVKLSMVKGRIVHSKIDIDRYMQ